MPPAPLRPFPRLLTQAQLESILGTEHAPCPTCGSAAFSITGRGDWICWGCDWDTAHADRGIAMRVRILDLNGQPTVCDADNLERLSSRRHLLQRDNSAAEVTFLSHNGAEWMGWRAPGWYYAARTFELPVEDLCLWIRRTWRPEFNPDLQDFFRGSKIPPNHNGIIAAWWPAETCP